MGNTNTGALEGGGAIAPVRDHAESKSFSGGSETNYAQKEALKGMDDFSSIKEKMTGPNTSGCSCDDMQITGGGGNGNDGMGSKTKGKEFGPPQDSKDNLEKKPGEKDYEGKGKEFGPPQDKELGDKKYGGKDYENKGKEFGPPQDKDFGDKKYGGKDYEGKGKEFGPPQDKDLGDKKYGGKDYEGKGKEFGPSQDPKDYLEKRPGDSGKFSKGKDFDTPAQSSKDHPKDDGRSKDLDPRSKDHPIETKPQVKPHAMDGGKIEFPPPKIVDDRRPRDPRWNPAQPTDR